MTTLLIGIIIQGIIVTTIKSMDIFLRTILDYILEMITKGGWVKPHVLVVWRLVTSADSFQQGEMHQVVSSIKEKKRKIFKMSKKLRSLQ